MLSWFCPNLLLSDTGFYQINSRNQLRRCFDLQQLRTQLFKRLFRMSYQMSGAIQSGETEMHSNKPGKTKALGTFKRYTNRVKTRLLSSFSRRTLSSSDSEDSNKMSRQLASKTPAGKDRSPKGLMSGRPFNQPNVHEISSVHSSAASFRARSLLSGRCGTRSDASVSQSKFLPNTFS